MEMRAKMRADVRYRERAGTRERGGALMQVNVVQEHHKL